MTGGNANWQIIKISTTSSVGETGFSADIKLHALQTESFSDASTSTNGASGYMPHLEITGYSGPPEQLDRLRVHLLDIQRTLSTDIQLWPQWPLPSIAQYCSSRLRERGWDAGVLPTTDSSGLVWD